MAETSDRRDAMQRVRIGLTGLAGVLVLVLFAAAVLGLRSSDTAAAPGRTAAHAGATRETPKDPLAELGVTPGGSGSDLPAPSATPKPASAPAPAASSAARQPPARAPR